MSRDLAGDESSAKRPRLDLQAAERLGRDLLRASAGSAWWMAAGGVLVLGGAAAGLHAPTAGAWFWQVANGDLVHQRGLIGSATYLAQPGAALDLRSWLADLGLFFIYLKWGLGGLEVLGALLGAAVGGVLFLAARARGRAHPLLIILAGGFGLLALAPVLNDPTSEVLALLTGALLLALVAARGRGRWGAAALVAVVIVWTNTQSDAVVAVLLIWGWLAVTHWEARRGTRFAAPSWWLLPLTGVALMVSPRGLAAVAELPLSLGMLGEHPLLTAWSSIDFHPWSARLAELAGMVLLVSYWLAGPRLRRADAFLGLATAAISLLWANYLPLFLVVAAVQSCGYLSIAWWPTDDPVPGRAPATPGQREGFRFGSLAAPLVAVLLVAALLGAGALAALRAGGPSAQAREQIPVQAASWLARHPVGGAWFTTTQFGDYLSSRFPNGHHLLCVDDPLPLAGSGLEQCDNLMVLNGGAMRIVRARDVRLAVLPRVAPDVAFLLAQGWRIRYRDSTSVVLAPRNS
jgi:hypothetical protein